MPAALAARPDSRADFAAADDRDDFPASDDAPDDADAGHPRGAAAARRAELREARAQLERTLDDHADLYQSSPVGYVEFDAEGVVLDLNERAAGLLGAAGPIAVGLPFVHYVDQRDHRAFGEHLTRSRRSAGTVACELRLAGDGTPRPVQVLTRRLRRRPGAFQTALVDQSRARAAEAGLRAAQSDLLARTEQAESRAATLARLHARLVEAERTERERLARHLHDHLQQYLVAAKMQAEFAHARCAEGGGNAELAGCLEKLSALTADALDSSRTLTSELTPPAVLREFGLPAAMHWLADFYETRHGLRVTVVTGGDGGEEEEGLPALRPDVRALLFEAARELLLNVVKYAGVAAAEIRVRAARGGGGSPGGGVSLTVTDEGEGFDAGELLDRRDDASGLGLFGLTERLEGRRRGRAGDERPGPRHGRDRDGPGGLNALRVEPRQGGRGRPAERPEEPVDGGRPPPGGRRGTPEFARLPRRGRPGRALPNDDANGGPTPATRPVAAPDAAVTPCVFVTGFPFGPGLPPLRPRTGLGAVGGRGRHIRPKPGESGGRYGGHGPAPRPAPVSHRPRAFPPGSPRSGSPPRTLPCPGRPFPAAPPRCCRSPASPPCPAASPPRRSGSRWSAG